MRKIKASIILFLFITASHGFTRENDDYNICLVLGGYMDAQVGLKVDRNLDFTSLGIRTFMTTDWGLRFGGFLDIALSSSELTEADPYLYSGLFGGILAGLELDLEILVISLNGILGAGGSSSNIEASARHFDFLGEITADAGFVISKAFGISAYGGFRCIGNLFPQLPGTAYFMYFPVWGLVFIF